MPDMLGTQVEEAEVTREDVEKVKSVHEDALQFFKERAIAEGLNPEYACIQSVTKYGLNVTDDGVDANPEDAFVLRIYAIVTHIIAIARALGAPVSSILEMVVPVTLKAAEDVRGEHVSFSDPTFSKGSN